MIEQRSDTTTLPMVNNKIYDYTIINGFIQKVQNVILNGVNHVRNIPYCNGRQCVPTEYLGSLTEIPLPDVGDANNKISALEIYNALVYVTTILLRTGTWSYERKRIREVNGSSGYDNYESASGRAFFSASYSGDRVLRSFNNDYVIEGNKITVEGLNDLFTNLYNAWSTSNRPHHPESIIYCHYNCNCHGDCNCNCYEPQSPDCQYVPGRCHQNCYGNNQYECHVDNYNACNKCHGSEHCYV